MPHFNCKPCPPEPVPVPLITEPCSICSPYPHVIPCDFDNDNQKHWTVAEVWSRGLPLFWNSDTNGWHSVQAQGASNPQLVIDTEEQHIDGCGCPAPIKRIEPVGSIFCEPKDFNFITPASLECDIEDSDDFTLSQFALFPDTLECEICDKPPILKEI